MIMASGACRDRGEDASVQIWDLERWTTIQSVQLPTQRVDRVLFAPNSTVVGSTETLLVTGGETIKSVEWNAQEAKVSGELRGAGVHWDRVGDWYLDETRDQLLYGELVEGVVTIGTLALGVCKLCLGPLEFLDKCH
jgi:WD40 repeat protein